MNSKRVSLFLALSASALLAACGGGGSDPGTPAAGDNTTGGAATAANSQGVYSGTVAGGPGNAFAALLLEDGSYYALSGTSSAGALNVTDFIQGTARYSGSSFTSSDGIDFGGAEAATGTVSATIVPATSLSGTATGSGGATRTFNGSYLSNSGYNYDTAASLSAISGSWFLGDLSGGTVNISISSTGALAGTGSQGCAFSGQVTPRASGKNVFDVTVTTQGAPCALPNTGFRGIALSYLIAGTSTRQLIVAGTDTSRAHGTAFFGTR